MAVARRVCKVKRCRGGISLLLDVAMTGMILGLLRCYLGTFRIGGRDRT